MIDYELLDKTIKESDFPVNVIARKAGMTVQSLHNKRTGKREITVREMLALCKVLEINKSLRDKIFLK